MGDRISQLVIEARSGNKDSFGELYKIYYKEMYCYALTMTGDRDTAEDAVSETVLAAMKEISGLRQTESFKGWLFKILNACCRSCFNEKYSTTQIPENFEAADFSEGGIESTDLSIELTLAMNVLSQEEKEIVMLSVVDDYQSAEISEMLGISAVTVRSKLCRALKKLRKIMNKDEVNEILRAS